MSFLRLLLLIIEMLCAFLLVGVILLQKTKSQGLGLAFGSGMGETLFGSRAGNVLSKITIILGTVFLVNTLLLGILFAHSRGVVTSEGRGLMGGRRAVPAQRALPLRAQTQPVAGVPGTPPAPSAPASTPAPATAPTAPAVPAASIPAAPAK